MSDREIEAFEAKPRIKLLGEGRLIDLVRQQAWDEHKEFSDVVREGIRAQIPDWVEPKDGRVEMHVDISDALRAHTNAWLERRPARAE